MSYCQNAGAGFEHATFLRSIFEVVREVIGGEGER